MSNLNCNVQKSLPENNNCKMQMTTAYTENTNKFADMQHADSIQTIRKTIIADANLKNM